MWASISPWRPYGAAGRENIGRVKQTEEAGYEYKYGELYKQKETISARNTATEPTDKKMHFLLIFLGALSLHVIM